jgi:hypothetical protein
MLTHTSSMPASTPAELSIVNADARYGRATLIEPSTCGYLYVGARVGSGASPVVLPDRKRDRLLATLRHLIQRIRTQADVRRAMVFRAIVRPPTARFNSYLQSLGSAAPKADFDILVLVETESVASARDLRGSAVGSALLEAVQSEAESVHVMLARNGKRIADVDATRGGLFLFNHFAAADREVMLELWDHLAGWYGVETGLDNSVALMPVDEGSSPFHIVNWARWQQRPILHFWHQLSKPSFWNYVTPNLEVNRAASMPIYCRLVTHT